MHAIATPILTILNCLFHNQWFGMGRMIIDVQQLQNTIVETAHLQLKDFSSLILSFRQHLKNILVKRQTERNMSETLRVKFEVLHSPVPIC